MVKKDHMILGHQILQIIFVKKLKFNKYQKYRKTLILSMYQRENTTVEVVQARMGIMEVEHQAIIT